jgi:putative Mg2+ transporter-C (MgtC) family protein
VDDGKALIARLSGMGNCRSGKGVCPQRAPAPFSSGAGKTRPMTLELTDILLRLGAAAAAGIALGINRDLSDKPIGARTLGLVALGTASVTVATIQFPGMAEHPDAASRVLQGVIQGLMVGIGFIGGGVILRDPGARVVHGLTTAATVWMTAALGIACGLAMWRTAGIAVALALVLLVLVAWIERALAKVKG